MSTLRRSKTFSATYFCWRLAPFCCTLSGWIHKVAFLYAFFTLAPVIKSVNEIGCQPHSGQRTYEAVDRRMRLEPIKSQIWQFGLYKNESNGSNKRRWKMGTDQTCLKVVNDLMYTTSRIVLLSSILLRIIVIILFL